MFTARNGTAIILIVVVSAFVKIMYRKKKIRNAVSSQKGDSLFKRERVLIFIGLPFILKPVNPLAFFMCWWYINKIYARKFSNFTVHKQVRLAYTSLNCLNFIGSVGVLNWLTINV